MSLVINTNASSLNAQNNLTKSTSALAQATERLSSGLKINSAKDNAAGYAISTRFSTQIGGLSQASSNASDAISLAQTTGSALDEVTANLQAIRDLAVQSANGTYTDTDRAAIDTEVQQRLSEITRIANQTDFNGTKVLDGSTSSLSFQVGANVGQTISVALGQGVRADQVGAIATSSTDDLSALFASGASVTLGSGDFSIATGAGSTSGTVDVTGTFNSIQDLSDAINASNSGVSAAVSADGKKINLYSATALDVTVGTGSGASGIATGGTISGAVSGSLSGGDVKTVDDANALISRVDTALTSVSNLASNLGAIQNRFQSTISTLSAESANLTSSQSTIQDADFAAETANLSKAQVLQQAGISVLSQANSQPQQVLKLLQ
jgi:flagellin